MPVSRRQFIRTSLALTMSSLVSSKTLFASNARTTSSASALAQELALKRQAKYTLVFASPYASNESNFIPHMHYEFKHAIQTLSQGKIYVELHDNSRLGAGTELMAAVNRGKIDAALISVSNLSRALPILDILNIPFWASDSQAYLNLISSDVWQEKFLNVIKQQGKLEVLFHYLTGSRTLSTTHTENVGITRPEQLENKVLRVPSSRVLQHFYQMTKANVVEVNWSKVASMAKAGNIDVLDPGIIGLYAGPNNLRNEISTISTLSTVPDAWVNVINQDWLRRLPTELQLAVRQAAKETFLAQINKSSETGLNCRTAFEKMGCRIVTPTIEERAVWQEMFGYQRPEWRDIKKGLLGSTSLFDRLVEATHIPSEYKFKR